MVVTLFAKSIVTSPTNWFAAAMTTPTTICVQRNFFVCLLSFNAAWLCASINKQSGVSTSHLTRLADGANPAMTASIDFLPDCWHSAV